MALRQKEISFSDSVKEKMALEVKKLVEKQVKKELAKRRKKFARQLIITGITFTVGCVIYAFSDQIVDFAADRAFDSAMKRKKSKALHSGRKR